jgi:hypothetical protein
MDVLPVGDTSMFHPGPPDPQNLPAGEHPMIQARSFQDTAAAIHDLRQRYVVLLLPAAAGVVLIAALRSFLAVELPVPQLPASLSAVVFVVSVCTAVALPILYRTLFANQRRGQTYTPEADWLRFERGLLYIAMATPYVVLVAQILALQRLHLAGTLIMSFYAVYYYYPSKKRIDYDRRMFRVYTAP